MKIPFKSALSQGRHCNFVEEAHTVSGVVDLDEKEVSDLVALVKDNQGETDVKKLCLEEKLPEVYRKLDEAYHAAFGEANYRNWLMEGHECGFFERPDGFMESLEEAGLYKFEVDLDKFREDMALEEDEEIDEDELEDYIESEKDEAFDDWLDNYYDSLDEDGKVNFIETYYGDDVMDQGSPGDFDYVVELPQAIIDMANS